MAEVQQFQLSQLKLVGDIRRSSHSGGYHTGTYRGEGSTGEEGKQKVVRGGEIFFKQTLALSKNIRKSK